MKTAARLRAEHYKADKERKKTMKPSTNMADLHAVYERCCRNRRLSAFQLAKRQMYSSPEAENTK